MGPMRDAEQINQEIGRRLRLARRGAGQTQHQFGQLLGVSAQQVQKYETGKNRISAASVVLVAEALDVPARVFLPLVTEGDGENTGLSSLALSIDALPSPLQNALVDFVKAMAGQSQVLDTAEVTRVAELTWLISAS